MVTKTTSVVFKQHDPQSAADLSGVAGAPLLGICATFLRKNSDFWRLPVEKGSPSTIWGVSKFVADFRFWKYSNKKSFSFFRFVFNIFFREMRRLYQQITNPFETRFWPHISFQYIDILWYIIIYHYNIFTMDFYKNDIWWYIKIFTFWKKYFIFGILLISFRYIFDIFRKYRLFIDISQKMICLNISK